MSPSFNLYTHLEGNVCPATISVCPGRASVLGPRLHRQPRPGIRHDRHPLTSPVMMDSGVPSSAHTQVVG